MSLTRRQFAQNTLNSLVTYSLLDMLIARDAFAGDARILAAKWIKDLNELSQDVTGKKVSQIEWQKKVDSLFDNVDLTDTLKFLDFEKLTANIKYRDQGALSLKAKLPRLTGCRPTWCLATRCLP